MALEVVTNWSEPLPPGFRFHPTHEEAIKYYLMPKVLGYTYNKIPDDMIPEVDILSFEPWDLAALLREKWIIQTADNQDEEWWFFCQQKERARPRARAGDVHRSTHSGSGHWKKTGNDLMIKARDSNEVIGRKKNVVFYKGRDPNGIKTNWVIHEFHAVATKLDDFFPPRKNFVLCSLKQNLDQKASSPEEQKHRAPFSEWEIEAMMNSLVERESQVQIDLFDQPQLCQLSPQSENNVSFDLQQLQQLHRPSFRLENSSRSNSIGISLDDDFSVMYSDTEDEGNEFLLSNIEDIQDNEFFLSNIEDVEDNVPLIHQQAPLQLQPSSPSENSIRQLSSPWEIMYSDIEDDGDVQLVDTADIDCDYFGGDPMQMERGQTSTLYPEQAIRKESRRAQATDTIQGFIPLDEKKRFVQTKVNSGHASSARQVVPKKEPANEVRVAGRDAQNVIKHELAATKIKLERASLDESSGKAKVVEINEQKGATIPSQKQSMKKTEQDGLVPKSKKKSTCKDTEIFPFYSLVYLRNLVIGFILLAITRQVLYFCHD